MLLTCSILQLKSAAGNGCLCAQVWALAEQKHYFNFSGHKKGIGNILYLIYITEIYYWKI